MALPAPYFDPIALRHKLTAIYNEAGNADAARQPVLLRLKKLLADARLQAKRELYEDHNGRRCAAGLSDFQDELIKLIFDYTVAHVYRATNPSDAERMALVATGGYGRGLLAPGSDIDLLFLLSYKQTPWGESVAEYMLYVLWDLGFKVGHATRTIDQCIKLGTADMTIRTGLLDARRIHGDPRLFANFEARFRADVVDGTEREFIDAKMGERDVRIRRTGESRYKVEPNVKDGKGGLRDLHTLHWLSKYIYGQDVGAASVRAGFFTEKEAISFRRCEDFLWSVRCFLHFTTGRAEEVLSFDLQAALAENLGYKSHHGLSAVERFMKHYFLIAKEVGDLTSILCGTLEMQQLKSVRTIRGMLKPLSWKDRSEVRNTSDFRIENDRLNIADANVFMRDSVNYIRIFARAVKTQGLLHPAAIRRLRETVHKIDDKVRENPEANRLFLEVLLESEKPEIMLRRMNESGVLGRFIPDFGRVVAMMQFNMYHHYTVDEHLLRTVGNLTDIESGSFQTELPLATELIKTIKNRRALFVAAFLHDIGKGRDEDHSVVGAQVAAELCPRLGLTAAETKLVVWLIAEHLTMSNVAQSRDISDPKTVSDFAQVVQSPERLKLLSLLTVADIRAVGPGVWNGWKGQLIRTLYHETEPRVAGGHTQIRRSDRISAAQDQLRQSLEAWPTDQVNSFIERHYPNYWLRTDASTQVRHAELLRLAAEKRIKFATHVSTDAFAAVTELTIFAPNHARLLSLFAGACSVAGSNIAGAQITTTRDGYALDSFYLNRAFADEDDEIRRGNKIASTIDRLLQGKERLADLLELKRAEPDRLEAFNVESDVIISNSLSEQLTVIEVSGLDRVGLLYDLTTALSELSLDIRSAHITTFGEKIVDVFYVTDLVGRQLTSEDRKTFIRQRLINVLDDCDDTVTVAGVPLRGVAQEGSR